MLLNFTIGFVMIKPVIEMTKEHVLKMLMMEEDYLSGETVSRELGITRAAVSIAVKSLREEGYIIDSVTNRGDKLLVRPDILSEGAVAAFLPEGRMDNVCFLKKVDSTNDYLRQLAQQGAPQGQVVISDYQTKGKGRQGRSFDSPPGAGVYFSYLFRPNTIPSDTAEITAWSAVAVQNAIRSVCGFEADIKWINDLVVGERKLCGILTELSVEAESGQIQFVIIGVGINCNESTEDFAPDIQDRATSMFLQTGSRIDRSRLAAKLVGHFDRMVQDWPDEHDRYLEQYRQWCSTTGRMITVFRGNETETAYAEHVDDHFGLVVRMNDGSIKVLNSGEVSTRNK